MGFEANKDGKGMCLGWSEILLLLHGFKHCCQHHLADTLGRVLLRISAESGGRGSACSTPVRCQFSSLTRETETRLCSFAAFVGNLSSTAEGWEKFVLRNYSYSLYTWSQKGVQFLKRL